MHYSHAFGAGRPADRVERRAAGRRGVDDAIVSSRCSGSIRGFSSDACFRSASRCLGRVPSRETFNELGRRLQAGLAALPGVTGVGSVSHLPYDNLPNWGGPYITQPGEDDSLAPMADNRAVDAGVF